MVDNGRILGSWDESDDDELDDIEDVIDQIDEVVDDEKPKKEDQKEKPIRQNDVANLITFIDVTLIDAADYVYKEESFVRISKQSCPLDQLVAKISAICQGFTDDEVKTVLVKKKRVRKDMSPSEDPFDYYKVSKTLIEQKFLQISSYDLSVRMPSNLTGRRRRSS